MVRFTASLLLNVQLISGSDDGVLMQSRNGQEAFDQKLEQDALKLTKPTDKTHKNANTHAHLQTMHQNLMQGVKDRMATGGKAPVSTDVANALADQFTTLQGGLTTEATSQQARADALNNPIQACNTAKTTAFTRPDGVNFLATTVSTARTTHRTCRESEATNCNSYIQEATTLRSSAPTCGCGNDWRSGHQITTIQVADGVEDCMEQHQTWMANYQSLVTAQSTCSSSVSTCNANQGQFESDFCQYREGLHAACDGLATCLAPQGQDPLVAQRETAQADLQMLENSQKELWSVVQRCKCWINLLRVDAVPSQTAFDRCANMDPSTCAGIDDTDICKPSSELDLTFPTFLAVETCDATPVQHYPGDGTWRVSEYDNKAWVDLLRPLTPCIVAAPAPPPPAEGVVGHWDAMRANTIVAGANDFTWEDLSNGEYDVQYPVSGGPTGSPPSLVADAINGHPAVYFSGTNYLSSTKLHPTYNGQPFTWFVVMDYRSGSSGWTNFFTTEDGFAEPPDAGGYVYYPLSIANDGMHGWSSTTDITGDPHAPQNQMVVLTGRWDGAICSYYEGGSRLRYGHVSWGRTHTQAHVMMGRGGQNTNHQLVGYIGEIVAYNTALPDAEVTNIVQALQAKWA